MVAVANEDKIKVIDGYFERRRPEIAASAL
jgi:hypothetical protein